MLRSRASTPASNRPAADRPSRQGLGFSQSHRLTRGVELQRIAREGKRIRTTHLDVRAIASPLGHPRVGIIVPRYSESAVARNRVKRRLRELVRTCLLPAVRSVDVVIRAHADAYAASFDMLKMDVMRATAQVSRLFA